MPDAPVLSYLDVGIAGVLVFAGSLLSWSLQLGVSRDMLWGAVRSFVQLALVGYVLAFLFTHPTWYWALLALSVMLGVAVQTAHGRVTERLPGKWWVFTAGIVSGSLLVLAFVIGLVMRIEPWYDPRYLLPLAGMIVGNGMNAAALGVTRFAGDLRKRRAEVETALMLGATADAAVRDVRREALRTAILPTINSLLVVGIVSLPGMMTGQILAGQDPAQAVRYQIVAMYMITAAGAVSSAVAVWAAARASFTPAQQLRLVDAG